MRQISNETDYLNPASSITPSHDVEGGGPSKGGGALGEEGGGADAEMNRRRDEAAAGDTDPKG